MECQLACGGVGEGDGEGAGECLGWVWGSEGDREGEGAVVPLPAATVAAATLSRPAPCATLEAVLASVLSLTGLPVPPTAPLVGVCFPPSGLWDRRLLSTSGVFMSIKFIWSARPATAAAVVPFSVAVPCCGVATPLDCLPSVDVKLFVGNCMCKSLSSIESFPALAVLFSFRRGSSRVTPCTVGGGERRGGGWEGSRQEEGRVGRVGGGGGQQGRGKEGRGGRGEGGREKGSGVGG